MPPESEDSKTFWEHLIVLRRYIGISLFSILAFAVLAHQYYNQIIKLIFLPLHGKQLVFLAVTDPIFFIFKVDLFVGFLVSLPLLSWLSFKFLSPAFSDKIKTKTLTFCSISVALTIGAICYAYFVTVPLCIKFLFSIQVPGVENLVTAQSYINFLLAQMAVTGAVFQIPLIMIIGTSWGLLNPYWIVKKRGWVYMATIVGIGFFVPPDFFSLLITIVPALLVFEASIILCKTIHNRRLKKDAAQQKNL